MSPYPIPDRRQHPRIAGMVVTQPGDLDADSPIHILTPADLAAPPQAGNVWFTGPEPDDTTEPINWWPVTGMQIASFWALLAVLGLLVVAMSVTAAGLAHGMAPAEIIAMVFDWGHP